LRLHAPGERGRQSYPLAPGARKLPSGGQPWEGSGAAAGLPRRAAQGRMASAERMPHPGCSTPILGAPHPSWVLHTHSMPGEVWV